MSEPVPPLGDDEDEPDGVLQTPGAPAGHAHQTIDLRAVALPTLVLEPEAEPEPDPPQPPLYLEGAGVTQALCSSVHLYQPLAKQICDGLLGGQYNAPAPVWGVDLVALMRHARESMQRWGVRDQRLRWITLIAAAVALFQLPLWLLGAVPGRAAVLTLILLPLAVTLASYFVVFRHYAAARDAAARIYGKQMLWNRAVQETDDPREKLRMMAGAAVSADDVKALEALATANVVTFTGSVPFVGDGQMLENWTLSIDLARARRDASPGDGPPHLDTGDLHAHMIRRLRQKPLAGMRVDHRLYVRGKGARGIPTLCDDSSDDFVRPHATVPPEVVATFAAAPTPNARAYVAAQRVTWGGQLIVTLLVHARVSGTVLHVEGSEHVLPPLKGRFVQVGDFASGTGMIWRQTAAAARRTTWLALRRCWPRLYNDWRNGKKWARSCRKNAKRHRDGVPFDYGVKESLRETSSDPSRMAYYALGDEIMSAVPMRRAVLRAVAEYVEARGFDAADLREQEKQIDMIGVVRLSDAAAKLIAIGANKG